MIVEMIYGKRDILLRKWSEDKSWEKVIGKL